MYKVHVQQQVIKNDQEKTKKYTILWKAQKHHLPSTRQESHVQIVQNKEGMLLIVSESSYNFVLLSPDGAINLLTTVFVLIQERVISLTS